MSELKDHVLAANAKIREALQEMQHVLVGQEDLLKRLMMAIVMGGHVLIEGVPGLAKTTAVKTLAEVIAAKFKRVQFTPDLLPADLLGTQIYNPKLLEFFVKKGPIFSNIILADEINRAPAKVQSALLEAMQEHQVTIGDETFPLEDPFFVLATQNPIEQEGTYPLPEAQLDRFAFKLTITYPSVQDEIGIMKRFSVKTNYKVNPVLHPSDLKAFSSLLDKITVDSRLESYIVALTHATRAPESFKKDLKGMLNFGASPRASIVIHRAARALALFEGREFVLPQDIKSVASDVLRHRIGLSFEAQADNVTADEIILALLSRVPLATV